MIKKKLRSQRRHSVLRPGDLVGHRQQSERQYEVMTMDERWLLAMRFIALWGGLF